MSTGQIIVALKWYPYLLSIFWYFLPGFNPIFSLSWQQENIVLLQQKNWWGKLLCCPPCTSLKAWPNLLVCSFLLLTVLCPHTSKVKPITWWQLQGPLTLFTCEVPIQFCYASTTVVRSMWGKGCKCAMSRRQPGEDRGKPWLWGHFSWPPVHASRGTVSAGEPCRQGTPETLCSQMTKGLYHWTALGYWTGPVASCQQADLGRSRGHRK